MDTLEKLLSKIDIPKMIKVRQKFPRGILEDIPKAIAKELDEDCIKNRIKKGDRVALAVGSRGIANISVIIKEIVKILKEKGAKPFIVPTMGSHGGATAEGQVKILEELGITEEFVDAPIRSTMEVVEVAVTESGLHVCIDKYAHTEADSIIVIGRIKPHTSFRGKYGSGLAKMIVIGLGKQIGAEICHSGEVKDMPFMIEEMAETAIKNSKIAFGVGIIENAYDETMKIVAIPSESIMEQEPDLLIQATKNMPRIMVDKCDVLIVDEAGKNIAGPGMDPNIIRRHYVDSVEHKPLAQRIVILDLTKETQGNATGMGNADICTKRFFSKIDFNNTNANPLTNRITQAAKIPMVMENDKLAIKAAIKTCSKIDYNNAKIIRIKNTLKLDEILISENLIDDIKNSSNIEIIGEANYMDFDKDGNLF